MSGEPARVFPRDGVEDDLRIFEKIKAQGGHPLAPEPGNEEMEIRRPEKKLALIPAILIFLKNALQLPEKKAPAAHGAYPRLPAGTRAHVVHEIPAPIPAVPEENKPDTLTSLYGATARMYQTLAAAEVGMLTASFLQGLYNDLDSIIERLIPLKDPNELESPAILDGLIIARNKLDFALALFDIEDVDPLYRLVIRNKVIPKVRSLLEDVLLCWPGAEAPRADRSNHSRTEAGVKDRAYFWLRRRMISPPQMASGLDGDRQTHATFRKPSQQPPMQTPPATNPPQQTPPPKDDPPPKPQKNSPKGK